MVHGDQVFTGRSSSQSREVLARLPWRMVGAWGWVAHGGWWSTGMGKGRAARPWMAGHGVAQCGGARSGIVVCLVGLCGVVSSGRVFVFFTNSNTNIITHTCTNTNANTDATTRTETHTSTNTLHY